MALRVVLVALLATCGCKKDDTDLHPVPVPQEPRGPSPGEVDDQLIAHVQAGQYDLAYGLMTQAYRDSVPLQRFSASVSRNQYLRTSQSIGCDSVVTHGGDVHVRECTLQSTAGNARATLYYARDRGQWRMTGMLIGGVPAFPGPDGSGRVQEF